ncbi:hypothetical protein HMPREF9373_2485 [Psychrobacter sp. 1501(2011)]|nr:hypothetical protein HMPREF9373_2485 [Psychrobacter sp. 1501(2011)]
MKIVYQTHFKQYSQTSQNIPLNTCFKSSFNLDDWALFLTDG